MIHSLIWKVPLGLFGFDGSIASLINNKGSVIVLYIKNFYISGKEPWVWKIKESVKPSPQIKK